MTLGKPATFPSAPPPPPPPLISPLIYVLVDGGGSRHSWMEPDAFNNLRPGVSCPSAARLRGCPREADA